MTKKEEELVKKLFSHGCIIIWRRPGAVGIEGEPLSVYMYNPEGSEAIGMLADEIEHGFSDLDEIDEQGTNTHGYSEDEDFDDSDDEIDEDDDLGIFGPDKK